MAVIKKLVFLFFIFGLSNLYSQNVKEKISVEFNNNSFEQIVSILEEKSRFKFFYEEDWFHKQTFTGSFNNQSIDNILIKLFEDTTLNFYLDNNNVIITKNVKITSALPQDFFQNTFKKDSTSNAPIFREAYSRRNGSEAAANTIIKIGREDNAGSKKFYSVSGIIVDADTDQPLQNVALYTSDRNRNTISNDRGYFELRLPKGQFSLETSLIGYSKVVQPILVYGDGNFKIELKENLEMLGDVIIESNKNENFESSVMGVSSINPEEIKTIPLVLGERDILKVATTLPGITTGGEGAMGYNVRGGRTDQNLILLDDAVIYSPSHFLGFFSAINPFTIGGIDIYKGNIPAEYGGRLSSVFDITTKDANFKEISGEGSIGPVTGNLSVEIPVIKDKASLIIGGRAAYSDWILDRLSEENLKNSRASFYDGIVKYKHKLTKKDQLQFTLYLSEDKFSITTDSLFHYQNKIGSLKWLHEFTNQHRGELTLVQSRYDYDIDYDSDNTRSFNFNFDVKETQAKLKFNYSPGKFRRHKFVYGVSSKLYEIAPGTIAGLDNESLVEPKTISEEKGLESAVFLSDDFDLTDKLLINLGIRYSFFTALGPSTQNKYRKGEIKNESTVEEEIFFGNNEVIKTFGGPELRASVRYLLGSTLSLKGSYNKSIQYIHLLSNNTTASPIDTYKLSDYNIQPQRASQYALGLYKNLNNQNLELSLEGFYKSMDNLLDYKVGADLILNEKIETELLQGEGKAYGVEFLLRKDKGKLNGYIGYSFSRSLVKLDSEIEQERVNNGNFFPANQDRPHDFTVVSNYRITDRYSISGNFTYQTGRPVTYPVGRFNYEGEEHVLYSDRNQYRIPDYYRLDLGINIEGNHKIEKLAHSFWNISVYNVLGRNNPYSVYFVNEDGKIKSYKTSIFSIPVPTITYNFRF